MLSGYLSDGIVAKETESCQQFHQGQRHRGSVCICAGVGGSGEVFSVKLYPGFINSFSFFMDLLAIKKRASCL